MSDRPSTYSSFKTQIEELKHNFAHRAALELQRSHQSIETFFQTEMLNAQHNPDNVEAGTLSYYVEINKQMRLLGADLTMLQAARNPATKLQRQEQAIARLDLLIGYCNALL